METIRQNIIELLSLGPLNASDISKDLGISEKDVIEHLPFIERTIQAKGKKFIIHPSICLNCGFVFSHKKHYSRPGKCPKCRKTRIQHPAYEISG